MIAVILDVENAALLPLNLRLHFFVTTTTKL